MSTSVSIGNDVDLPLGQSREFFRCLFEFAPDAILVVDHEGRITRVNQQTEKLFGYARSELLGERVELLVPHGVAASHVEHRTRYSVEPHTRPMGAGLDLFARRKDGTVFPVDIMLGPVETEGGACVLCVLRDITARQRAEEKFRGLMESAPDAMIIADSAGMIRLVNAQAERLFGYERRELVGQPVEVLIPDRFGGPHREHVSGYFAGPRARPMDTGLDLYARRRDGSEFPAEISLSPLQTEEGTFVCSTIRDVSVRKQAMQRAAFLDAAGAALGSSLDYQTTLKTVASLAVPFIADLCEVHVTRDDGLVERLAVAVVQDKIALAQTIRERYEDPYSPYSAASVMRVGAPVMIAHLPDEMIVAAAHGDEERISLVRALGITSYICVPMAARGRILGALSFTTTGSRRRYTDDDLRFTQEIASRAALAVDNACAHELVQAANRVKDDFLATLSHELRTPLTAILGYARMLQSGRLTPEKQGRALDTVERNATSLARLVEDVLDVSRIIKGRVALNVQTVELSRIVEDTVQAILPAAHAKGVLIQTIVERTVPPSSGDPERLRQVVWNLLSNAVKFTHRGGRVLVRVEPVESHVEIIVSDTGIGIRPDFLPYVFERFQQADSHPTRQHGGLGIGLAIARHLVEMHGGTIHAASGGEGQGATFRIMLPVMAVLPVALVERRVHAHRDGAASEAVLPNLRDIHVLAVDDDSDALDLVREVLEAAGARVTTVDSGLKALDSIDAARPDVLVSDVGMPTMDGYELLTRIRRLPESAVQHVPAAALTAYARTEDRVKALQSGFQMYLAKPIDPGELVAAVATLAGRLPSWTAPV